MEPTAPQEWDDFVVGDTVRITEREHTELFIVADKDHDTVRLKSTIEPRNTRRRYSARLKDDTRTWDMRQMPIGQRVRIGRQEYTIRSTTRNSVRLRRSK